MKTLTTLKQTITLGFIGSTILLTPLIAQGITVEEVANPRSNNGGWVTDMANVLSDRTEREINRKISDLEQTNGSEIAVVTVPDTSSAATPKEFATELFNDWGIGKANLDNGVLFLISIGDRRVEIETGTGLQNILSDAEVQKIIDTKITPRYKKGNLDRGTIDGTSALVVALNPPQNFAQQISTSLNNSANPNWNWGIIPLAGGMMFIFTKIFSQLQKRLTIVSVNPSQKRINLKRNDNRSVCCAKCQQPMDREHQVSLTKPQQIAQRLSGASFRCYKCATCSDDTNPYVTLSYSSSSHRHQICPHCDELTVIRTKTTLQTATRYRSGEKLIADKCHCCDYKKEQTQHIPRLPSYSSSSSSSSSSYSSYGSSSSSCSGDSGGSFGGGSSDGGGAGGGW